MWEEERVVQRESDEWVGGEGAFKSRSHHWKPGSRLAFYEYIFEARGSSESALRLLALQEILVLFVTGFLSSSYKVFVEKNSI